MSVAPSRGDRAADVQALLIVEPDAVIARLLALVCAEEGYTVARAASPDEALALLAERGPAAFGAILSDDCALSAAAPYAWLDRLRARAGATPIVICTRRPAATYADHRARGYAAVVEEPCALQDLLDAAARACRAAADGYAPRGPSSSGGTGDSAGRVYR